LFDSVSVIVDSFDPREGVGAARPGRTSTGYVPAAPARTSAGVQVVPLSVDNHT